MSLKKLGVIMDPIADIHYEKDSTLAMLWEAKKREFEIYYFEMKDLFVRDGKAYGNSQRLSVFQDPQRWYAFDGAETVELSSLDIILMRKDPPFDSEYIYATYILELAEKQNVLVVNKPQSLRDANEKMFTTWFPECCPPSLVARDMAMLKAFHQEHRDIVCKPLDGMGGASVFHVKANDDNVSVILETLTQRQTRFIMAQKFIPEIEFGDKRILMINGEPIPFALARVPAKGEWRGNLAAGAKGVAQPLTTRDRAIAEKVGPVLRAKGLHFVGLDVIGNYLTEINVTSPTCIRELNEQCDLDIAQVLFAHLESLLRND